MFRHTGSNLQGISGAIGTLTMPIGHDFGLQIDLTSGTFRNAVNGGAAGHLFWRNPDKALFGIYGSGLYWAGFGGKTNWNIGPEIEFYLDRFTIGGTFGAQGFNFSSLNRNLLYPNSINKTPCNHQPIRFFDNLDVKYYPIDDFMVSVGHTYTKGNHAVRSKFEFIPEFARGKNIAPSIFGEAVYGWNKSSTLLAGIKIYFGNSDKPLVRRQREDDPAPVFNTTPASNPFQQYPNDKSGLASLMQLHEDMTKAPSCIPDIDFATEAKQFSP